MSSVAENLKKKKKKSNFKWQKSILVITSQWCTSLQGRLESLSGFKVVCTVVCSAALVETCTTCGRQ